MTEYHDALDRYLDDLATGEEPITSQLDPELVATIDRLSEIGQTPLPPPDFVDHLEERLMNAVSSVAIVPPPPIRTGRPETARVTPIRSAQSGIGAHRWLPILVSAAVILVVLGLAWRQFGSGEPDRNPQLGAPAIQAPATPSPAATGDQTLVDIVLPADVVPVGEEVNMLLARDTIPASSETSRAATDCCPGTKVYYVLDGSVSVDSDGPMELVRPGTNGAIEEIAAGELVDLAPGDTLVVRNEHRQTWTAGATPVDIITMVVASGFWVGSFDPAEWVGNGSSSDSQTVALPAGPFQLTLRSIAVTADQEFPLPANGINQLGMSDNGTGAGKSSDGSLSVAGVRDPFTLYIMALATAEDGDGTPVAGVSSIQPAATATP